MKTRHIYVYIRQRLNRWAVKATCKALAVSESGFYRSLKPASKKQGQQPLLAHIQGIVNEHEDNQNYGVQRMVLALAQKGINASYSTVYRIMKKAWAAEKIQASSEWYYTRRSRSSKETKEIDKFYEFCFC